MKWGLIFEKYTFACYEMYKWIVGEAESVSFEEFDERIFHISILNKGYFNNEERAFEFFDCAYITCYVLPLGFNKFTYVAESEYRKIIGNSCTSRREASIINLGNAFDLLEEREIELKKIKSTT